jgi:aspartyl-tRNA(Asn)/glutamyl-tRNA(Gln) amidotransferase subunit C
VSRPEDTLSLHRDEIEALARLAHLRVPDDGMDRLAHELDRVLGWLAGLQQVDVTGVPETLDTEDGAQVSVVLREDVAGPVLEREAVLAGVPAVDDGQVVVPRFVEE